MERGVRRLLLSVLFLAVFVWTASLASANIIVGSPENIYNIGDDLRVDITLNPASSANDFLTIDIVCSEQNVEIYRNPFNLAAGEEVTIEVIAVLSTSLIDTLRGTSCVLRGEYNSEIGESQDFEITGQINIELDEHGTKYAPGDSVVVSGAALKKSGGFVDGFLEVSISSLDLSIVDVLSNDGIFAFTFPLPENALSGEHTLSIRIYEEDEAGVGNEGIETETIEISQVLEELSISVGAQTIIPGNELQYIAGAYDQAGELIDKDITVIIYEAGDFVFSNNIVQSGAEEQLLIEETYKPGYWKIEAIIDETTHAKKLFYVEEIAQIQTSLVNDTLLVTNTGNVPYKEPLQISIGSVSEVKQLNLDVGATKQFKLYAPDGTYSISINDGDEDTAFGNVFLTGRAVSVEDVRDGIIISFSQPLLWILAILFLALIVLYIQVKRKQKSPSKKTAKGLTPTKQTGSSQSDVLYGTKEQASIIALKLDDKKKVTPQSDSAIDKALMSAKQAGAKVYIDGSYRIIVFSPTLMKTETTEITAVRAAKRIEEILNEHNKTFKQKIRYGIGVNTGTIISEVKNKEFTFTTVGSVITRTKRIAQFLDGETLLSDTIRRRVTSQISSERVEKRDVWRVAKIANREKHAAFLDRFTKEGR